MNFLVGLLIVGIVGAIVFLNRSPRHQEDKRKKYLEALADFLEGRLDDLEGYDNSYKITFQYKGQEFIFEDIEGQGFQDHVIYKGCLKIKTPNNFTLNFTEKARSSIRTNVQSIEDVSTPWGKDTGEIRLPKNLLGFIVHTNNQKIASLLLSDEKSSNIFGSFKNIDARGHPVMSLEIMDGLITLIFHAAGELKPSLWDLQHNVTSIEAYFDELLLLANKLKEISENMK